LWLCFQTWGRRRRSQEKARRKQRKLRKESSQRDQKLSPEDDIDAILGELFRVLLEQGIHGLKVSELAKSLQISELNISSGIEELESLIGSTLSSDITFENDAAQAIKISSSTYRVRINSSEKKVVESQSDTEDSGAVDDDLSDNGTCRSDDDSGRSMIVRTDGRRIFIFKH
ncbi:unnamed protein product, partial [Prunus brigantina]